MAGCWHVRVMLYMARMCLITQAHDTSSSAPQMLATAFRVQPAARSPSTRACRRLGPRAQRHERALRACGRTSDALRPVAARNLRMKVDSLLLKKWNQATGRGAPACDAIGDACEFGALLVICFGLEVQSQQESDSRLLHICALLHCQC